MNADQYNSLAQEFGPVKWVSRQVFGFPQEGWFLLEITPCPASNEIDMVVSDIIENGYIHISKGKLYHSDMCTFRDHKVNKILKEAINNIKEETFLVAVYPGCSQIMKNQPVAIVIDPVINYERFPGHPHLNMGGPIIKNNRSYLYFPDSICYGYSDQEYGNDGEERLRKAFGQISMWLFRHQIWVETRKIKSPGIWIGPHSGRLGPEQYTNKLNPFGECRCGNHKNYIDCHMPYDYTKSNNCSIKDAERFIENNTLYIANSWRRLVSLPQQHSINLLSSALS